MGQGRASSLSDLEMHVRRKGNVGMIDMNQKIAGFQWVSPLQLAAYMFSFVASPTSILSLA